MPAIRVNKPVARLVACLGGLLVVFFVVGGGGGGTPRGALGSDGEVPTDPSPPPPWVGRIPIISHARFHHLHPGPAPLDTP